MDETELLKHAIKFGFGKKYEDKNEPEIYEYEYFVEARGQDKWAVTNWHSSCYDSEIKDFILEPSPSNRDDEFLKTTRFTLDEALNIVHLYDWFCYDYCTFLNVKEWEQNKHPDKPNHVCLKYNTRVKHGPFHPKLIRCEECLKDD